MITVRFLKIFVIIYPGLPNGQTDDKQKKTLLYSRTFLTIGIVHKLS